MSNSSFSESRITSVGTATSTQQPIYELWILRLLVNAGGFVELKPVVDLPCVRVTVRIGERQEASQRRIRFKKEAFGLFRRDAGGTGAERGNEFVAAGTIETIQYPVKKVVASARCR